MSVAEKLKGRGKERVGEMTGNKRLEREGKVDRAAENVKEKVDDAAGKVKEILRRRDERQSEQ